MSLLDEVADLSDRIAVVGGRVGRRVRPSVAAWKYRYRQGVIASDFLVAAVVAVVAFYLRFGQTNEFPVGYIICTALFPPVWLTLLGLARAHETRFLFTGVEEFRKVVIAGGVLMVGIALASYAGKIEVARGWVLLSVPPVTLVTLAARYGWRRYLQHRRWTHGDCLHRAVVVGYERATSTLVHALRLNRYHGFDVVGACLPSERIADAGDMIEDCALPVLGSFDDVARAVETSNADIVVVLACPELDGLALRRLGWELERSDTDLLVAPALLEVAGPRVSVRPVADLPLLHVQHTELTHWRWLLKSCFDKVGAAIGLVLCSPALLAIGAAIKIVDPGPVLFRQVRVGHGGDEFSMLKFRTMCVDAESKIDGLLGLSDASGVLFKMRNDPRVTRIGSFLRRYSLDELPQLINVLCGQMSLVGPRPPLPREVEQYERDVYRRFAVRPGVTGLWQVSGRSDLSWEDAVRLDIRYVERWSLLLDIFIILRTLGAVLRRSGAY